MIYRSLHILLSLLVIYQSLTLISCKKAKVNPSKHVLFIVADDLGWADVGYEDVQVISPNIDRLARTGVILNQTYTYSLCTPSRNSILSGVYAEHTGLQHEVILPELPVGLPTSFTLLPKALSKLGYSTHMVGKWHLGFCSKDYTPVNRGFDSFYGFFNAQEDYYTHRLTAQMVLNNTAEGLDFWNQTADYLVPVLDKNNTYGMHAFTKRATEIFKEHKEKDENKPLFMYFSSQNCHLPNQVPKEYEDKYYYIADEDRRKYLGMVTFLDDAIGNLTKSLDELGMLNNTLIFFTSDNGGATYSAGRNYPLRGGKMTAFEGGHRVRAFVNGPDLKPYVNEGMFHAVDWLPTILSAAVGVPFDISGIDGINQWPAISQNLPSNRTSFIYNIDPYGQVGCLLTPTEAIRDGDWKLIKGCPGMYTDWYPLPNVDDIKPLLDLNVETNSAKPVLYLFNLKDDPLEKNNLAETYPDTVKSLEQKLEEYKKTSVSPLVLPLMVPDKKADPKYWGDTWSPGWC